jgi:hypothetical protein
MRIIKRLFLFATVIALAAGCQTGRLVSYNSTIDSVERPEDTAERYGEYTVSMQDTSYVYEDELVRAAFATSGSSVFMSVENKTDYSIQVLVEQGAFVMPSGSSERILLGDMSYANRNQEVQPITVPSGASSSATLIPQSNVSSGQYGLNFTPIFGPSVLRANGDATKQDVEENIGKTFSLLLPMKIQDAVNEYTFNFEVTGARIEGGRQSEATTIGTYPSDN